MIIVLHYIGSFEQGGSQAMILNLYQNIDRNRIQFDFVVHTDEVTELSKEAIKLGASIYRCPRYSARTCLAYNKWWNDFFIEHTEYQIVHSHVRATAAIVLKIAKKYGCVTIAHSHSTSSGSGISSLVKNVLQYRIRYVADYFMGCSQVAGEWLFGKKICSTKRYYNVKNAIDTDKYTYDKSIAFEIRNDLGYTDSDIVFGHVGRLSEPKNHSFLLDVYAELHKRNVNYKLLLVGEGELRCEIEKKIKRLGIENCVKMEGARNDVNKLMMAMDLFLFPSKWEGLGIVMIEAQATDCPCIASDTVPKETKLLTKVKFLPINKGIKPWVEMITAFEKHKRSNQYKVICESGYDIKHNVIFFERFYSEILRSDRKCTYLD